MYIDDVGYVIIIVGDVGVVDDVCDVDVDDVGDVGNVMQMKWNECGKNYLGDPWQELSGKNEGLCASWKSLKGL